MGLQIDLTDHYNADALTAIVRSVEITDRTRVCEWVTDDSDDTIAEPTLNVEGRFRITGDEITATVTEL